MLFTQREIGRWAQRRWPEKWNAEGRAMQLLQEAAEALVACKQVAGNRAGELEAELNAEAAHEIGDVAVTLDALGYLMGVDVQEAKAKAFERGKAKHGEVAPAPAAAATPPALAPCPSCRTTSLEHVGHCGIMHRQGN